MYYVLKAQGRYFTFEQRFETEREAQVHAMYLCEHHEIVNHTIEVEKDENLLSH